MNNYALEIHAEGFPHYVGTFFTRMDADKWAENYIANGSWNVFAITPPAAVKEVNGL